MPRRNDISKNPEEEKMRVNPKKSLSVFFLGILAFIPLAHPQADASGVAESVAAKKSPAEQCAPDLAAVTERVFANPGGKTWNEYATVKKVPRLDGDKGEMTVTVKTSASGHHFVRSIEYGEDNARFQTDCYEQDGRLLSSHYEMRTAWGWGYEEKRTLSSGKKAWSKSVRFFDLKNNQAIQRPEQAGDVPDFTKPSIYNNFDSLPVAGALKQKANATQK
jgi:hypothetical protein